MHYKTRDEISKKAFSADKQNIGKLFEEIQEKIPNLFISQNEMSEKARFEAGISSITDSLCNLAKLSGGVDENSIDYAKKDINKTLLKAIQKGDKKLKKK